MSLNALFSFSHCIKSFFQQENLSPLAELGKGEILDWPSMISFGKLGEGKVRKHFLVNNVWRVVLSGARIGSHEHIEWESRMCSCLSEDLKEQKSAGPSWGWRRQHSKQKQATRRAGLVPFEPFLQNAAPSQFISLLCRVLFFCLPTRFPSSLSMQQSWSAFGSLVALQAEPLPYWFRYTSGETLSFSLPLLLPAPWIYCMGF